MSERTCETLPLIEPSETPDREVKCRRCYAPTILKGHAYDVALSFSRRLLKRGERHLDVNELVCCDRCRGIVQKEDAEKLYAQGIEDGKKRAAAKALEEKG